MSSKKARNPKPKKLSPPKYKIGDVIFGKYHNAPHNTIYLKIAYIISMDDNSDWLYYSANISPTFTSLLLEARVEGRVNNDAEEPTT